MKEREVIILAIYPSFASEVLARQNAMTTAIAKEGIVFMLRVAIASFGVGEKTAAKKEFPQKKTWNRCVLLDVSFALTERNWRYSG